MVMDVAAFQTDYMTSGVTPKNNRGIMFQDNALLNAGNTSAVVINYASSSYIKPTDGSFTVASTVYCWTRNASETEGSARNFYASGSTWELRDGAHANAYPVRCQLIETNAD